MPQHLAGLTPTPPMEGRVKKSHFFPQDHKVEGVGWKSPLSPSNSPDFLPSHSDAHAASPHGRPASQLLERSVNSSPVSLLRLWLGGRLGRTIFITILPSRQ